MAIDVILAAIVAIGIVFLVVCFFGFRNSHEAKAIKSVNSQVGAIRTNSPPRKGMVVCFPADALLKTKERASGG